MSSQELAAAESGISPQQYVDNITGEMKKIWEKMNISYDRFIRTTDDYHVKAVQKIFKKLYDKIASGEPAAVIDKSLFDKVDGSPNWMMFTQNVSARRGRRVSTRMGSSSTLA